MYPYLLLQAMGIKDLNGYLQKRCTNRSIRRRPLYEIAHNTIVVDASIYIYKFLADGALIENMFVLASHFIKYHINAIFIFDGKPPEAKTEAIARRVQDKENAEQEYKELEKTLDNDTLTVQQKETIQDDMKKVKRKFVRVKNHHIDSVKKLFNLYGIKYIEANGEADQLCAQLCISGFAYGCLSDDMDMLVYGCPRIFRCLDMKTKSIVWYEYENIIREMKIPSNSFQQAMYACKNDYNDAGLTIPAVMRLYSTYRKVAKEKTLGEWLCDSNHVNAETYDMVQTEYKLEDVLSIRLHNMHYRRKNIDYGPLCDMLLNYNFIRV